MEAKIEELKSQIKGRLITPEDKEYDDARQIYNGMIDKHPGIILKCKDTNDVIHAVNFGRENNLEIAIKSGGHHGAGLCLVNDGLVIDLSEMKKLEIDAATKTAVIEPGNLLSDIDAATYPYGLALPSGIIGSTGIGGITLGGGTGYLTRKGGLTIDNLLECKVVLANGKIVIANKLKNPDLFWALRGGGGNFGVVVSFKFKLIEIKDVYAGPMFWPIEKAEAALKFYDKITKNASNDLYGFFAFLIVPAAEPFPENLWNKNVCGVVWNYTGPREKAEEIFKSIREFGPPILDFVGEIPMKDLNGMFDGLYPPGYQWYWRAHYMKELSDGAIQVNLNYGSKVPTMHSTTHLYPIDGAVHNFGNNETAWANRDARWIQVFAGVDPDPDKVDKVTNWCKNYFDALKPYAMGGSYVNMMMDEGQERVKAAYKDNYERLTKIKGKYDPKNLFHINQNIEPCE
ncbi:FAD-binding oxidoreductase [Gillisia hiemivivida]|uniref:FAD-binding oxidoreductase n=1 Tax=Gillisia hiemivivida TaxID=291190 RepID=A0A5C6ZVI1_9FLAO|nr:FAD-binding oxidoreductase [Gillisia hiemivivida]TXD94689.1 FAD-binding oxidoreductase [Gillisia hiemivivida]